MTDPETVPDSLPVDRAFVRRVLLISAGVAALGLIIALGFYFQQFSGGLSEAQDLWGQFGDYLGGVLGPLFSLMALFALLITAWIQFKNVTLTSEELDQSVESLQEQTSVLQRQNFENTFFHLLELHNTVVNDTVYQDKEGRAAFESLFKDSWQDIYNRHPKSNYSDERAQIHAVWNEFFETNQQQLGHYFRLLYNVVKFIDNSPIDERQRYVNIVRAQLSTYELGLLFYNCLGPDGEEKFKPLAEKYALFEDIEENVIKDVSHKRKGYEDGAFSES